MRIHESVVINRPPDEVWAFWIELFNTPRARPGALSLRWTSPGPTERGSVLQGRMTILGFETRFTMTVTEFDPPRSAVVTLVARPGRGAIRTTLEPTPEGTRVDRTTDFEAESRAEAYVAHLRPPLEATGPRGGTELEAADRGHASERVAETVKGDRSLRFENSVMITRPMRCGRFSTGACLATRPRPWPR